MLHKNTSRGNTGNPTKNVNRAYLSDQTANPVFTQNISPIFVMIFIGSSKLRKQIYYRSKKTLTHKKNCFVFQLRNIGQKRIRRIEALGDI